MKSDEWCNLGKEEIVKDDKKHRCSACGRRLNGRGVKLYYESETSDTGLKVVHGFQLPPHKKKGYKIKRKKGHNQKIHDKTYFNVRKLDGIVI